MKKNNAERLVARGSWLVARRRYTSPPALLRWRQLRKVAGIWHGAIELELIQTQMTQKPMLRAEVYARALRASQNRKEDSV